MTDKSKVGMALRNIRTKNTDFSVTEVARKVGKSKVWLSQIETGKRKIYFDDVQELCDIYGIDMSSLGDEIKKL